MNTIALKMGKPITALRQPLPCFHMDTMIKIALHHQVFIDHIKRILCWDSFICFIVMSHAHLDR